MSEQSVFRREMKTIESYVREIIALNRSWKKVRALFGNDSSLAISLRELKTLMQVRLLWDYGSEGSVSLTLDHDAQGEAVYGILIHDTSVSRKFAEHIPVRVVQQHFADSELEKLTL